jgi:putative ABC transport system permease protein
LTPRDLGTFALTALVRHRLRTSMSLIGVAIGVAAVVSLTALGEGARSYVTGQFSTLGSSFLVVLPGKNETTGSFPGMGGVPNDLTLDDARALQRGVPKVNLVAPVSMGNETVAYRERRRQVIVVGSTKEFLEIRQLKVAVGRSLPAGELDRGAQVVLLGATVADELFRSEPALGRAVRVGDWRMRVIGVLERRGEQVGFDMDDLVIVPVATGMRIFNRNSLFRVVLGVGAHHDVDAACARAVAILTERHGEEDVTCITQESVVSSLSSILTVLTLALGGIAAISLSVAGIGIMNLMLVSVSERTREVGLLKAIGADTGQILAVFLAEAILIASMGGLLGLTIGWASIRVLVLLYPAFPASTPLWAIAAALVTSVCMGAVFGVLPARRAARLDPVAALAGK